MNRFSNLERGKILFINLIFMELKKKQKNMDYFFGTKKY